MKNEILRSSFTVEGEKIFLEYDPVKAVYRLSTRWHWLTIFDNIYDACEAFEALEYSEDEPRKFAKACKLEITRVPRFTVYKRNFHSRIYNLVQCTERRLAGYRPRACGAKHSIVEWIRSGR